MKKLFVLLLAIGACNSMDASIKNWDYFWNAGYVEETYDFEEGGVYYGIVNESPGEIHVMNPNLQTFDPMLKNLERDPLEYPGYRDRYEYEGEVIYDWPGGYYEGDIEIPAEVEHNGKLYKVVRIAFGAFAWCDKLTSVKLPPTIREIRYGAFSMCTSLKEVSVPPGTKVCGGAFYGCTSLEFLDLSGCIAQYNEYSDAVVCYCTALRKVYLPSARTLEPYTLYYKSDGKDFDYRLFSDYYLCYDGFPLRGYECEDMYDIYRHPAKIGSVKNSSISVKDSSPIDEEPVWKHLQQTSDLLGCPNLKEIHCSSWTPLNFLSKSDAAGWEHLYEDCVLYVPNRSLWEYRDAEPWKNFKNIVEEEVTSGLEEAMPDIPDIDASADGERQIYDLSGRQRATVPAGKTPALSPGLYIERTAASARKLRIP